MEYSLEQMKHLEIWINAEIRKMRSRKPNDMTDTSFIFLLCAQAMGIMLLNSKDLDHAEAILDHIKMISRATVEKKLKETSS